MLDAARAGGATAAETEVSQAVGQSVTVRNGEVETIAYNRDKGIGVTVFIGQRRGHASTADFAPEAVAAAVAKALAIARYTAAGSRGRARRPDRLARDLPDLDLYHPWDVSVDDAIAMGRDAEAAALAVDRRLVNTEGSTVARNESSLVYANSNGFCHGYRTSRHHVDCSVIGASTDMLTFSPEYASRFPSSVAALASGQAGSQGLAATYGRSLEAIARDLRNWSGRTSLPAMPLPVPSTGSVAIEMSAVSPFASRLLIADLLSALGELVRAEALYRDLDRESPRSAGISAALARHCLPERRPQRREAGMERAIDLGLDDPALCYRYATLASAAGVPADEVRRAFEKAIALKPDFDDALYSLALLEKNAGDNEAALAHLRRMRKIAPARAFHYWCATADALTQIGNRQEAGAAARRASEYAATAAERSRAAQLAYVAQTDLAAQFVADSAGSNRMVMTRIPHNTEDWNPFIEPGDEIRRAQGTLREIDCAGVVTRFRVDTATGPVMLSIRDFLHMQARNAPAEFTCGPQPANPVTVVYTAAGILRGIEFAR